MGYRRGPVERPGALRLRRCVGRMIHIFLMRKAIALGLTLAGLFDALYLFYTYTSPSRPMVCIGSGCDAVRASAYSNPWGVPMPVFGAVGYMLLAAAIMAESLFSGLVARLARRAFLGMSGFGFLFSLYLDYLQAFKIHAYCAWCLSSGALMTGLFALAIFDAVRPAPEPDMTARLASLRLLFAISVGGLAIGVPSFYVLARHGEIDSAAPQAAPANLADRLARPGGHEAGNPQAALTVVEFGDFECPVCGRGEAAAREIRKRYAGQIRFVFRQFPLERIHPLAEKAAEASECAGEQGKFWEAVEKIYSRQEDLSVQGLERDGAELGLDQPRFKRCLAGGAMAERVRRDVEDGRALGVRATPTFFIGRKAVESVLTVAEFEQLIAEQLTSSGVAAAGNAQPAEGSAAPAKPATSPAAGVSPQNKPAAAVQPVPVAQEAGAEPRPATSPAAPVSGGLLSGLTGGGPGGLIGGVRPTGAVCSEADAVKKQPTMIHTQELRQLLAGNPGALFVDVRPAAEYAAGRIPGATNIPADEIERRWSTLPKDRTIVLYESGRSSTDVCAASRAVGRALLEHGFDFSQVKVYQDGLAGWEASGLGKNK